MKRSISGFTVIELLVVIIIVGILASLATISYSHAQRAARDTKRKADLAAIAEAIQTYRQNPEHPNDIQGGSGCGDGGNGSGWFNHAGGSYPKSILSCLTDKGYLNDTFIDPFNCTDADSAAGAPRGGTCKKAGYAYMKYSNGSNDTSVTCLFARLENEDHKSELTNTTNNPCSFISPTLAGSSFNMNYMVIAR